MIRHARSAVIAAALALLIVALLSGFGATLAAGPAGYTWVGQNPLGTGQRLYATSALSATAVWSVGEYGTILYWNGTTLTKQNSGTTNNLYGVYARSAGRVWAVGEKGTILFYNGTAWAPQGTGVTTYDLTSVTAGSNTTAWAAGGYDGFRNAVILRTTNTGTNWAVQLSQATGGFTSVYAFSATRAWAVNIWTWYWNGTTWAKVNDGNSATGVDPYRITGYSGTNLWAVGWSGKVLYSNNAGTTWNEAPAPPDTGSGYGTLWPSSISSLNGTNIYVAGWGGSIAMYNGATWATRNSGTTKDLNDIDIFGTTSVFAAGDTAFIRYGTPTWSGMSGGTGSQLNAVHGRDANNVWTVGTNVATYGNIQSTTNGGSIWNTQASSTTNTLNAVDYFDSTHIWTGGQTYLNFWNGSTWTTQINGTVDTVTSTVAVGTQPRSATVNAATNKVYTANATTNNVSVIDGGTDTVITTVAVGTNPRGVCANPATNKIYVGNNGSNNVTVLDGATDAVLRTVAVGSLPYRLSANPATNKIYVANYGDNTVSVIDGATDTVTRTVSVGTGPLATGANPSTNKIYVANYGSDNVSVIDGVTDTVVTTVAAGSQPYGVDANSSTNKIYVPNNNSANVSIINGATDTLIKNLTVGTNPRGVCANPATNRIYVANFGSNNVSVVDGSTDTVATTITVGTGPFGVGVNSSSTKIYVANYTSNNVSVINGKDRTFNCVTAAAANRVWAGADDGWIRYYNGTTWSIQNPDPLYGTGYYGISAPDITHVWAVGASGEIVYWNGTSWAKQTSNTANTLHAVNAVNASTAWAVGDGGTIRYTSNAGATWQTVASGTSQDLLGVSAADATHVWAVGAGGTILFYNGSGWAPQDSPTTNNLRAVFAYDANDAWAVGDNGTIIFADPPYIKTCAPGWANPGDTVDVEVIGAYTHFSASTPTLSFGDGVSVVPGSVNVWDNTHILAQVQVDPDAALGPRDVNATTFGETPIPLAGGFVVGATPTIASVSRSSAPRGWTGEVEVTGSQTGFSPASQATFGSGITVNSVTCRDIDKVTANITVGASAMPGPRSVNVTTGGEIPAPLADGFAVPTPPGVTGVAPGEGLPGSEVTVTGTGFGSSQGTSSITFNGIPAAVASDRWSDGAITTTVPFSARTGPVVVRTTAGGSSNNDKVFTVDAPTISSCTPGSARRGDTVEVHMTGAYTNFLGGTLRATFSGSGITVNSTTVTDTTHATANITVAADAKLGARDVNVITGAETPDPDAGGFAVVSEPVSSSAFYFSEGYTGANFAEYLCIGNPNSTAAIAHVTYFFADGTSRNASYNIPATGRTTVDVNSEVGPGKEVSMRVLSDTADLVAERPMYFNYNGVWTGGSDAVGATAPNRNWYLAEGNTLGDFDEYVSVLNTSGVAANLTFRYMVEGLGEKDVKSTVAAYSRATFKTRDQIGSNLNASLHLSSDQAVVAERPMYFNYRGLASSNWTGGHDVVGANSPQKQWYLAEGTTRDGFEEWLCLANPGSSDITVNATYQLGSGQGAPISKSYTVPARQRVTVSVNREIGPEKDDSVKLTSNGSFVAERSMYFDYQGAWTGGHDVLGANSPATTWLFAEGTTRDNFNEWLCIQNPGNLDAHVNVTCYTTSGQASNKLWTVRANSRLTVDVNEQTGPDRDISTKVSSDNPIIVERPMYFDYNGWTGGHVVVGFRGK
jgi:YVTN family beta-propeller protein